MDILGFLNLKAKVFAMLIILLTITGWVAWTAISSLQQLAVNIEQIAEHDLPVIGILTEVERHQMGQGIEFERAIRHAELMAVKMGSAKAFKRAVNDFEKLGHLVNEELEKVNKINQERLSRSILEEEKANILDLTRKLELVAKHHDEFHDHALEIFELFREGQVNETEEAIHETEELEKKLHEEIGSILKGIEHDTEKVALETEKQEQAAVRLLYILSISALIVGLLIGLLIIYSVLRQLGGEPAKVAAVVSQVSEGNLKIDTDKKTTGLLSDVMKMVRNLQEIVTDVTAAADNVASGSQQLSSTAEELSQGTSEQASAVEEMAASIQQNSDNSQQTDVIAQKASIDAESSGQAVSDAMKALKEISEKISIIQEISRQTNMLALNAAIEAARAREHGKGFAVVAAEVRKLAESSQTAASEITELASSSVEVAEQASTMLESLVPDIKKTADLVQEINAASKEQNSGVDQINAAIQQNASGAEELASTAEELSSMAEQLLGAISFFETDSAEKKEAKKPTTKKKIHHHPQLPEKSTPTGLVMNLDDEDLSDNDFEKY